MQFKKTLLFVFCILCTGCATNVVNEPSKEGTDSMSSYKIEYIDDGLGLSIDEYEKNQLQQKVSLETRELERLKLEVEKKEAEYIQKKSQNNKLVEEIEKHKKKIKDLFHNIEEKKKKIKELNIRLQVLNIPNDKVTLWEFIERIEALEPDSPMLGIGYRVESLLKEILHFSSESKNMFVFEHSDDKKIQLSNLLRLKELLVASKEKNEKVRAYYGYKKPEDNDNNEDSKKTAVEMINSIRNALEILKYEKEDLKKAFWEGDKTKLSLALEYLGPIKILIACGIDSHFVTSESPYRELFEEIKFAEKNAHNSDSIRVGALYLNEVINILEIIDIRSQTGDTIIWHVTSGNLDMVEKFCGDLGVTMNK